MICFQNILSKIKESKSRNRKHRRNKAEKSNNESLSTDLALCVTFHWIDTSLQLAKRDIAGRFSEQKEKHSTFMISTFKEMPCGFLNSMNSNGAIHIRNYTMAYGYLDSSA